MTTTAAARIVAAAADATSAFAEDLAWEAPFGGGEAHDLLAEARTVLAA